jgi:hypothetical protein
VYVADRENGRIEKFDLDGNFLAEIPHLGRIYSLKLAGEVLCAGVGPLDQPPDSPGWVLKLDKNTGKILGTSMFPNRAEYIPSSRCLPENHSSPWAMSCVSDVSTYAMLTIDRAQPGAQGLESVDPNGEDRSPASATRQG